MPLLVSLPPKSIPGREFTHPRFFLGGGKFTAQDIFWGGGKFTPPRFIWGINLPTQDFLGGNLPPKADLSPTRGGNVELRFGPKMGLGVSSWSYMTTPPPERGPHKKFLGLDLQQDFAWGVNLPLPQEIFLGVYYPPRNIWG